MQQLCLCIQQLAGRITVTYGPLTKNCEQNYCTKIICGLCTKLQVFPKKLLFPVLWDSQNNLITLRSTLMLRYFFLPWDVLPIKLNALESAMQHTKSCGFGIPDSVLRLFVMKFMKNWEMQYAAISLNRSRTSICNHWCSLWMFGFSRWRHRLNWTGNVVGSNASPICFVAASVSATSKAVQGAPCKGSEFIVVIRITLHSFS